MRIPSIRRFARLGVPPPALRHRDFLDGLRRGRRNAPCDLVAQILRHTRLLVRAGRPVLRLRIDVRPVSLVRTTVVAQQTAAERRVEHVHTLHKVHRLERLLRERCVERVRTSVIGGSPPSAARPLAVVALPMRRGWQEQAFPRLAMATVRSPAAAPARTEPALPSPPPTVAAARAPATWSPAAALVLPADELSRVTDHVLRTLDRRVLSYRERTGQV
ncbi:hypothetical protein [Variovorax sp. YR752]|uniref:hypothetical protein n=1 Tax=Variovorax sp. YR752 TaxID=1884383 RepID=UPI003137994E